MDAAVADPRAQSTAAGPLDGIKVLDLSSVVFGPLAAQSLGDMGADVIKVESPEGDITRLIGPRRSERMGALFLANNRNKRSVVLDLKSRHGREALRVLVAGSDVLLHSIRSQAAERIGISYDALAAINPRLIYCHMTGFSDAGLYAGKPAYDDIVQALSGLAMLQTAVAAEPRYMPTILADKISAVHAAYAVVLALFHRGRTGAGQCVRVPMLETLVAFNMSEHLGGCVFEPPLGTMGYPPIRQSMRRPFKTTDGYLCFVPYTDAHWKEFAHLIGAHDITSDPAFMTMKGRQANIEKVWSEVARQLALRTNAEWIALCAETDIPIAPVNTLEEVLADPHLASIGFWRLFEHKTEGTLRLPASPLEFSASPASIRRLPPALGEHTAEVFEAFGISPLNGALP